MKQQYEQTSKAIKTIKVEKNEKFLEIVPLKLKKLGFFIFLFFYFFIFFTFLFFVLLFLESTIEELVKKVEKTEKLFEEVCKKFAEDPKSSDPAVFLLDIDNFLNVFNNTRKDIMERQIKENKKKEQMMKQLQKVENKKPTIVNKQLVDKQNKEMKMREIERRANNPPGSKNNNDLSVSTTLPLNDVPSFSDNPLRSSSTSLSDTVPISPRRNPMMGFNPFAGQNGNKKVEEILSNLKSAKGFQNKRTLRIKKNEEKRLTLRGLTQEEIEKYKNMK